AGEPGTARRAIQSVMRLGVASAATAFAVLALGGAALLGRVLFHSELVARVGPAIGLWSAAFAIQIIVAEAFRGLHAIRDAGLYSGAVSGFLTVIGLIALRGALGGLTPEAAVWTATVSTTTAAVIAGVALVFRVRRLGPPAPVTGYGARDVLRSSLPI